jgi:hypothetical protein
MALVRDVRPDRWGVMRGLFDAYCTHSADGSFLQLSGFLEVPQHRHRSAFFQYLANSLYVRSFFTRPLFLIPSS